MKSAKLIYSFIYLSAAVAFCVFAGYYADNPDTFQYISIAKKYLSGNWSSAVNGYWSPLISWVLILPLKFFNDSVLAFKLVQLLTGLWTLLLWNDFLSNATLSNRMKLLLTIAMVPFILVFAILNCSPDLLFVALTLSILNQLLNDNILIDSRAATRAGITGGLLFLCKAFGLPFFLFLLVVIAVWHYRNNTIRIKPVRNLIISWLIICGTWIAVLSVHYGTFTINKSATFNSSLSIEMLSGGEKLPVLGSGIIIPKTNQLSAWEEPGEYEAARTNPATWQQRITRNLFSVYYTDFRRQAGALFLVLIVFAIIQRKQLFNSRWMLLSLAVIGGIYCGYSLILVHDRYTWTAYLLMIAVSSLIISTLKNTALRRIAFIIFLIFIIKKPLKEILFTYDKPVTASEFSEAILHPLSTLKKTYKSERDLRSLIEEIKLKHNEGGNLVAGDSTYFNRDPYASGLRIAEATGMTFYGTIHADEKDLFKSFPQLHYLKFSPDGKVVFVMHPD